jgi:hypothetical protein
MIEIPDISGDEGLATCCQVGLAMLYGNNLQCMQVRVDEKNPSGGRRIVSITSSLAAQPLQ